MKSFSKIVLYIVAISVLSWFLPWIYALMFPTPSGEPFCSFSPVNDKWIISQASPGEKPTIMILENEADGPTATIITRDQRDSLVPQLFYKELLAHDRLPDTLRGKAVSAHELRSHELMFTSSPRDIVKRTPGVWMMMESMPVRVELSDPTEVFRFTDNGEMEFIDMATNSVVPTRGKRFTETMKQRGFVFPATDLSANITSRKQYDEGYLMIDSEGKLFHVKQRGGRPYVAAIPMPDNAVAAKAFLLEEADRSILGFVADTDNNFYIIERDGYTTFPLPVGKVNPRVENLMCMGNLFNLTFRFTGNGVSRWRAIERTPEGYQLIGSYDYVKPQTTASKVAAYIFPYTLSFVSNSDSLAYPRFANGSWNALYLNIVLALVLLAVNRKEKNGWIFAGAAVTIVCGIFSFIPFILLKN